MTTINLAAFTEKISDRAFEQLCADNPETKFETTKEGRLTVMSPTGSESGRKNSNLIIQLGIWNLKTKLGEIFDSSTGFRLSNGAIRSPDVSWITLSRWEAISKKQQRKFAPIDPDFVIELKSPTDEIIDLQQKMAEYMSCGVRLGWLINPDDKQVEIYRQGQPPQVLELPKTLSGEDVLPGLTVELESIFD